MTGKHRAEARTNTSSKVAKAAVGAAIGATLVGGGVAAHAQTVGPESHALSTQFSGVRTPGGAKVQVALQPSLAGPVRSPAAPNGPGGTNIGRSPLGPTHPGSNPGRVLPHGNTTTRAPSSVQAPGGPGGTNVGHSPLPGPVHGHHLTPPPAATPGGSVLAPGGAHGGTNLGRSPIFGGTVHGTDLSRSPHPH